MGLALVGLGALSGSLALTHILYGAHTRSHTAAAMEALFSPSTPQTAFNATLSSLLSSPVIEPSALHTTTHPLSEEGRTVFHLAAWRGEENHLLELNRVAGEALDLDTSVLSPVLLARDSYGCNVLHTAMLSPHAETSARNVSCLLLELPIASPEVVLDFARETTPESKWMPMHLAAAKGHVAQGKALWDAYVARGWEEHILDDLVHAEDGKGHSPLFIAIHNQIEDLVALFLGAGGDPSRLAGQGLLNGLHSVAVTGNVEIGRVVLAALASLGKVGDALSAKSATGETPLHLAAKSGNAAIVALFLEAGADVNELCKGGGSAFSLALVASCRQRAASTFCALLNAPDLDPTTLGAPNSFGATVYHDVAMHGNPELVQAVLSAPGVSQKDIEWGFTLQDYDGFTPIHALVRRVSSAKEDDERMEGTDYPRTLEAILSLVPHAVDKGDYGDGTPLYALSWSPVREEAVELAQILIWQFGADPTKESEQGWSAAHVVQSQVKNPSVSTRLAQMYLHAMSSEQVAAFDPDKPRDLSASKYLAVRGPHNRIPQAERDALLGGLKGAEAIGHYLASLGRDPKVVVMCGAGMSVAAGIPAYRTESGIYSTAAGRSAFQLRTLMETPEAFFSKMRELFGGILRGEIRPTETHAWLASLDRAGWLTKVFTQNVDMLELVAGVDESKLVESHGTLRRWRCTNRVCGASADPSRVWGEIMAEPEVIVPKCEACGALVRPEVVFFGEGLPTSFTAAKNEVLEDADLLVVVGTSLSVYPFAGMVNEVGLMVPRVLINREAVGPFVHAGHESNYRDVVLLGDSDDGVAELAGVGLGHVGDEDEGEGGVGVCGGQLPFTFP